MSGIPVGNRRQHKHPVSERFADSARDAAGSDEVDIERQMIPVLLDSSTGQDASLIPFDSLDDFGPGQFLVAILSRGSIRHAHILRLRRMEAFSTLRMFVVNLRISRS
jgi:hypothetical protein